MHVYGHFKSASAPASMKVGDVIEPTLLFSDRKSATNSTGAWWEGVCIDKQETEVIFEINSDLRGWHYG
jgi:hypothetical protein